jgi:hypothetical protein
VYLLNNVRKGMGIFFCYALLNRVPCHVISKLGNIDGSYDSKAKLPFGLELRAERLLPNFEMTTKLSFI